MKRLLIGFALTFALFSIPLSYAQSTVQQDEFYRGKIVEANDEGKLQRIKVSVLSGPEKNQQITMDYGTGEDLDASSKLKKGDSVILTRAIVQNRTVYSVYDKNRIPGIAIIFGIFFVCAIFFGRIRGLSSIAGMIFSLGILTWWVIPKILTGGDPLTISLMGAAVIAVFSLYLAHGFNKRTSIALVATLAALSLSAVVTILFVWIAKLSGTAQEEAVTLHTEGFALIDLKGLLLGGILIGALGILDDITTAQVAVIDEIHQTNPSLTFKELYRKGISVGHEHIASLINTLVLAYAGASFPLLLLFAVDQHIPMWVTLNSEFVAEEIVRTLAGSVTLVVAVPLATFLATYIYKYKKGKPILSFDKF